jgi:hypothetical protein
MNEHIRKKILFIILVRFKKRFIVGEDFLRMFMMKKKKVLLKEWYLSFEDEDVCLLGSLLEVYRRFKGTCCLHHQSEETATTQSIHRNLRTLR